MKVINMTALDSILKMDNPVQTYAWGSRTAIARLMGNSKPSAKPQAEIWMGAHPKAPSKVWYEDRWQPLHQLITQYPLETLGTDVADRFGNTLPYLFKILAAGEPLSIQAHPNKQQALSGYQRENHQGIDPGAANRNYKDDRHKPECMCALTPFWGLCGFRSLTEMMVLIGQVWPLSHNHLLTTLTQSFNARGLQNLFQRLMRLDVKSRKDLVARIVEQSLPLANENNVYDWIVKLNERYPGDIGVLSPLMLNVIQLEPGEAIFLPPRQMHAYLGGLGIELMANSDNVLRGGLTPKHVDIDELINILDFRPHNPDKLVGRRNGEGENIYVSQADEFLLAELVTRADRPYATRQRNSGPEILLCIEGVATIMKINDSNGVEIDSGHSVFVPSAVRGYEISGDARLFRAGVNL